MKSLLLAAATVLFVAALRAVQRETEHQRLVPVASVRPTYDEIALRAYFIGLERDRRGEAADPFGDWVEAEHQLRAS